MERREDEDRRRSAGGAGGVWVGPEESKQARQASCVCAARNVGSCKQSGMAGWVGSDIRRWLAEAGGPGRRGRREAREEGRLCSQREELTHADGHSSERVELSQSIPFDQSGKALMAA